MEEWDVSVTIADETKMAVIPIPLETTKTNTPISKGIFFDNFIISPFFQSSTFFLSQGYFLYHPT
jgi:hypothetical protein